MVCSSSTVALVRPAGPMPIVLLQIHVDQVGNDSPTTLLAAVGSHRAKLEVVEDVAEADIDIGIDGTDAGGPVNEAPIM